MCNCLPIWDLPTEYIYPEHGKEYNPRHGGSVDESMDGLMLRPSCLDTAIVEDDATFCTVCTHQWLCYIRGDGVMELSVGEKVDTVLHDR